MKTGIPGAPAVAIVTNFTTTTGNVTGIPRSIFVNGSSLLIGADYTLSRLNLGDESDLELLFGDPTLIAEGIVFDLSSQKLYFSRFYGGIRG